MKKAKSKWIEITNTQEKIGNILKIGATIVFLCIWLPVVVYIIGEILK